MNARSSSKSASVSLALLIVRLGCAMTFLYHGSGILFGAFGGPGPAAFAAHMHYPAVVGVLVGIAQFGGGLAMLSGMFIRVGAAGIIVVMLGAIIKVHLPHGFDLGKGGYEYALTELLIALAVLITGGGACSLAGLLPKNLRGL